ncbi:MAG: mercuric reductase [Anaerolineae bacterium]
MTDHYDAVVIGAGQAGGPLSTALAAAGWKVAIVEREHAGGTCVNEGCTPTKLMAHTARVAHIARRAPEYGVNAADISVDMEVVRQRKRDIVESWSRGSRNAIEGTDGVTYIDGEARFTGPHELSVALNDGGEIELSADKIFINTGQRPDIPAVDGLSDIPYLTNKTIMELAEVPQHLIVLGGGYVGLEFGQMFRRFGAEVTIVEAHEQFLYREDRDIAEAVQGILKEDGINLIVGTKPVRIEQPDDGLIRVVLETDEVLEGSHLLVATGRTPNTDTLDLDAAGIETNDRGYINVNDHLETSIEGVYALGDVNGGAPFTHVAYDDFRLMRARILEGKEATTSGRLVPYTMFIDPQLAHVGLHEHEAEKQGFDYRVATLPMAHVARAIETKETRGLMKAIVEAGSGRILGATVLGVNGGEIMSVLQVAMMAGLPYTAFRDGVFAHPLFAESLNNLFSGLDDGYSTHLSTHLPQAKEAAV